MHRFNRRPKRPTNRWLLCWLLALLPCAAVAAHAAAPECALLTEARVTGDSIWLSDLLPSGTAAGLRQAAGRISLGTAPSPGSSLTLEGARIARLLPAAERAEILIPPQVLVHRAGRPLTREEVARAIQAAARENHLPVGEVAPENVHFPAAVLVSASDPQLRVRRADFDAALHQDRFLLVSAADRRALPFLVTVDRAPGPSPAAGEAGPEEIHQALLPAGEPVAAPAPVGPPLVEPRHWVRLHVVSGNMQMFLQVVPLEKGALQELVRVKLPGSGQILRGRVTGPGQMEAQF